MIMRLYDKGLIEAFLRKDVALHLYEIGDLDDFFWTHTVWYAGTVNDDIDAIALLYTGAEIPTLLAFSGEPAKMSKLIQSILHLLPNRFHAHLSPGVEDVLKNDYCLEDHILRLKMSLGDPTELMKVDASEAVSLSSSDLLAIKELYLESYPHNWFDERMLATGQYFGARRDGRLIAIAGVHVYSEKYGAAALGNITTHPSYRRKGYGSLVIAAVCRSLSEKIADIGLNVKADDMAAVSCYEKLGFKAAAGYGEFMVTRK